MYEAFLDVEYSFTDLYLSCHFGETEDGKDFEAYLGKSIFHETIGKKFDDFLHETFSKWGTIEMNR